MSNDGVRSSSSQNFRCGELEHPVRQAGSTLLRHRGLSPPGNPVTHPAWARWLPVAAALAPLAAATAFSLRTGWADYLIRQETVPATLHAIALMPDQAEYRARLAWLLADSDPRSAHDALHRAVALNPQI